MEEIKRTLFHGKKFSNAVDNKWNIFREIGFDQKCPKACLDIDVNSLITSL